MGQVLQDRERLGHLDLEASEMAIRTAMHQMGGVLLEKLLNSDGGGYRGAHLDCSQGHAAEFVGYRDKEILTVVSSVEARRAYYHCQECQSGFAPKDKELDVVGSSFSPGVRRMMARVGAKESFEQGRGDLEALAGVVVRTKQVERISVQLGQQVEAFCQREREAIVSGKVTPLVPPVPILYIAIDGTGVPVVPRETEGRRGKDARGKAKTREAKIGCLFTQTKQDDEGYPLRDENSTWAPLRPPRPSVGGSMRRRCVAVCDRPPGWWCWEMVDLGSGGLPRCIFPGPSKSWISIMPVNIWRIWENASMGPPAGRRSNGPLPVPSNSTRGMSKR